MPGIRMAGTEKMSPSANAAIDSEAIIPHTRKPVDESPIPKKIAAMVSPVPLLPGSLLISIDSMAAHSAQRISSAGIGMPHR